VGLSSVKPDP